MTFWERMFFLLLWLILAAFTFYLSLDLGAPPNSFVGIF